MNYFLFVTGCQHNEYDAERLRYVLDAASLSESGENEADLIIVLACSVRQKAVDRIYGSLRKWSKAKRKPKVIISGCVLPIDKTKIGPRVFSIVSPTELFKQLPKILKLKSFNLAKFADRNGQIVITYGCNNYCTYCAVPFTRGSERSRSEIEIVQEAKRLSKKGATSLLLLGQNVNSYGLSDLPLATARKNQSPDGKPWSKTNPSPFVRLLNKLDEIPNIDVINFLSPNPQDLGNDFVNWLKNSTHAPDTIHMPLQSGSNVILKKMNRRYTAKQYLSLVKKLRRAKPGLEITTDIIVGFPSESDIDFNQTIELAKKVQFGQVFLGQYSPRPGTVSANLFADNVPPDIKKKRWVTLNKLINQKTSLPRLRKA